MQTDRSVSPIRCITRFAIPLMLMDILQQCYTITDTAVAGQFISLRALAALGAADMPCWIMLNISTGFSQGLVIRLSRHIGAGDEEGARKVITMGLYLMGTLCALLCLCGFLLCDPLLRALSTPEDVLPMARQYIRIYTLGVPLFMGYHLLMSGMRAEGNGKTPLLITAVTVVLNIVLDVLFVAVFRWEIAGAAAATVLSEAVSLLMAILFVRKTPSRMPSPKTFRPDFALMRELIALASPIALQNVVLGISGMLVRQVVNGYGTLFLAGYTATNKLYGMLEVAACSFGASLTTFCGQNLGIRDFGRIRRGFRSAFWLSVGIACLICGFMFLFGRSILSLFISASPEETELTMGYALDFLHTMSIALPVLYLLYVYRSSLEGLGNTFIPMLSTVAELCMRLCCVWLLTGYVGSRGTFIAEDAAWLGSVLVLIPGWYITLHRCERESGACLSKENPPQASPGK